MAFTHGTVGKSRLRGAFPQTIANAVPGAATIADTNETVLATVNIPKGALDVNGRAVRVRAFFASAANGNTKTFRVRLNGVAGIVCASFSAALNNGQAMLECTIWRISATTATSLGFGMPSSGSIAISSNNAQTVANFDTADQTLVLTGQNGSASAADCVLRAYTAEVLAETPSPANA